MSETPELHALLNQAPWIRALAQSLVRDPNTADDLVQETWVSALEHRPDAESSLRGWVTTVLRNHLGKLRRGEDRRRGREQAASRPESTPAVLDVVQRAGTHKSLVEAVLALEEPYRETILMRYFEQLSYAEIAQRTGVAEATVNSRLTRGLARLRERLDREHGGRDGLLAALIPICTAVRPETVAIATGASALMSTPFQISVAAALSVAGLVSVWQFTGAGASSASTAYVPARPEASAPVIGTAELALPAARERGSVEPQRSEPEPLAAEGLAPAALDDDWVADLSLDHTLGRAITKLRVNTGGGDVEVREGAAGMVSIDAKVKVDPSDVPAAALTRNFADHVKVSEDGEVLTIEDRHAEEEDEGNWNVSLVLRVPPGLGLAVNSGAGDLLVLTVAGETALNSGAGDVVVRAADRRAKSLALNSGAGDIKVDVDSVEGGLSVSSGAGDLEVRLGRGTPANGLRLTSGAGSIHFMAPGDLFGEFKLDSGIGTVEFPASWGLEVKTRGKNAKRATGQVGVGGPQHQISTGAGDVKIALSTVH